jgi:hypothetical protein
MLRKQQCQGQFVRRGEKRSWDSSPHEGKISHAKKAGVAWSAKEWQRFRVAVRKPKGIFDRMHLYLETDNKDRSALPAV